MSPNTPMDKDAKPNDCWLEHRVSYGEVDQMGYLYYGEYLHLFERARGKFIRESGMSYAEVEERGVLFPVREAHVRYRNPARYDELIMIRCWIHEWRKASFYFSYEVWDESRTELKATGTTGHACADKSGKPIRIPDWLRGLFA